jgi:hypothetical protein
VALAAGLAILFGAITASFGQNLSAESPDGNLFAVGTAVRDADGNDWAYLAWLHPNIGELRGRNIAVYGKPGNPDAAADYIYEGSIATRSDPEAIRVLLDRARHLKENGPSLDQAVHALYSQIDPVEELTVVDMLSALMQVAESDESIFNALVFMGREHPAVALCLGTAFADRIETAGPKTYELRLCPGTQGAPADCSRVIGRVTVDVGNPVVLQAPGAPVELPNFSKGENPRVDPESDIGDLSVKLRWGTPSGLRRQLLLLAGYNVYRVTENLALANGWDSSPPQPGTLVTMANSSSEIQKVNELPILPFAMMDQAEAQNFAGSLRYFVLDDNDRFEGGDTPFADGEAYYYTVCGADLLGRDGTYSAFTRVLMCDRIEPLAPFHVDVSNDYTFDPAAGQSLQRLKITWEVREEPDAVSYYLYRWNDIKEIEQAANIGNYAQRAILGPIVPAQGQTYISVLDTGPGAPFINVDNPGENDDANVSYYYTVRTADAGACGPNFSADSAPANGFLKDRKGPAAPTGGIDISYGSPTVNLDQYSNKELAPDLDPNARFFHLACTRPAGNRRIVSAEFFYELQLNSGVLVPLGIVYFPEDEDQVQLFAKLEGIAQVEQDGIHCRVTSLTGEVSPYATSPISVNNQMPVAVAQFDASIYVSTRRVGIGPGPTIHHPEHPETGESMPICVTVDRTEGAREYRIYRQINDGNYTLIQQGLFPDGQNSITVKDFNLPPFGAQGCYSAQLIDQNGNPSALVPFYCVTIATSTSLMPETYLPQIRSQGSDTNRLATLQWICAKEGVDHFEVFIGARGGTPPSGDLAPGELFHSNTPSNSGNELPDLPAGFAYNQYTTRAVGMGLNGDGSAFSIANLPIALPADYAFAVRAVMTDGRAAPFSNVREYAWTPPVVEAQPNVPWPFHPVVGATPPFDENMTARYLGAHGIECVGVRIGRANLDVLPIGEEPGTRPFTIPASLDPKSYLFRKNLLAPSTALPCVLYRYQVENNDFPIVSGDVYQVSPMVDEIAFYQQTIGNQTVTQVFDPFIGVVAEQDPVTIKYVYDLYVLDSQPALRGASYMYLLATFDEFDDRGEIEQIMAFGPVDIP